MKFLLGIDIGSSSVKVSLVEAETGKTFGSAQSPRTEMKIDAPQPGWAEQDPEMWWKELIQAIGYLHARVSFKAEEIMAIGISYQMHGLVLVDKNQKVLRPAIIWCDSRAVDIGEKAFNTLNAPRDYKGKNYCFENYLNAPGNFTASKLRWVMENEPHIWDQTDKMMLPGDYIAMRLTGDACTTVSGLSEGVLWDFKNKKIAERLMQAYGFNETVISKIVPTFGEQGYVTSFAASALGLSAGTPVTYRAGDQPNNAFSLNVLNPGDVAATAGTSGVIYGVSEFSEYDQQSRVNTFVHVNDSSKLKATRNGVLLCINGTGIANAWLKKITNSVSYEAMNNEAMKVPIGSEGVIILPFGNGAERIFNNKQLGGQWHGLDFNRHTQAHLFRATQEGIVFSLNYGLEIMKTVGVQAKNIRAGHANMFLSPLFREIFANTTSATIELFDTDGATGAARGAGVGVGYYKNFSEAFVGLKKIATIEPEKKMQAQYSEAYQKWLTVLGKKL